MQAKAIKSMRLMLFSCLPDGHLAAERKKEAREPVGARGNVEKTDFDGQTNDLTRDKHAFTPYSVFVGVSVEWIKLDAALSSPSF